MGPIKQAGCGKCMHHFCYDCLLSAARAAKAENKRFTCPLCRTALDFIQEDRDFDKIVSAVTAAMALKAAREQQAVGAPAAADSRR